MASGRKTTAAWFWTGMAAPACVFLLFLYAVAFTGTLAGGLLTDEAARKIISGRTDAAFSIDQRADGSKILWIKLPESGRRVEFWAPANASTLALLANKGVTFTTRVEGRDYHLLGRPGRWLPLLSCFIVCAGTVLIVRRFWRTTASGGEAR